MLMEDHWDEISFDDARVSAVALADDHVTFTIESVAVSPNHPANETGAVVVLPHVVLRFVRPRSVVVDAYLSTTGITTRLTPPYPMMNWLSEVVREQEDTRWHRPVARLDG